MFIVKNNEIKGIVLQDGKEINSKITISGIDMNHTYFNLLSENERKDNLTPEFLGSLKKIDYNSPVFKINLIVDSLPKFNCLKKISNNFSDKSYYEKEISKNYFPGTIHMNSESIKSIDDSYIQALSGIPSTSPMVEMTIPSILDKSLIPENSNHHVIGLFCQYAPFELQKGKIWDDTLKKEFSSKVYSQIEKYAPGFTQSILFEDLLSPLDLQNQFSLTGGNIFHGSMDINSISFCRPTPNNSEYKQPIKNLFSCSSAMHPGGGVMGAPGRNCALTALKYI
jgi:phytoene dehydrogenase-like protein